MVRFLSGRNSFVAFSKPPASLKKILLVKPTIPVLKLHFIDPIMYSDPQDDGYVRGDVYPEGPMRPPRGVQRGSVFNGVGDPATPGVPSLPGVPRLEEGEMGAGNTPYVAELLMLRRLTLRLVRR